MNRRERIGDDESYSGAPMILGNAAGARSYPDVIV
jgi:hypothetical protein